GRRRAWRSPASARVPADETQASGRSLVCLPSLRPRHGASWIFTDRMPCATTRAGRSRKWFDYRLGLRCVNRKPSQKVARRAPMGGASVAERRATFPCCDLLEEPLRQPVGARLHFSETPAAHVEYHVRSYQSDGSFGAERLRCPGRGPRQFDPGDTPCVP